MEKSLGVAVSLASSLIFPPLTTTTYASEQHVGARAVLWSVAAATDVREEGGQAQKKHVKYTSYRGWTNNLYIAMLMVSDGPSSGVDVK